MRLYTATDFGVKVSSGNRNSATGEWRAGFATVELRARESARGRRRVDSGDRDINRIFTASSLEGTWRLSDKRVLFSKARCASSALIIKRWVFLHEAYFQRQSHLRALVSVNFLESF